MSDTKILITDAGLAEIRNAEASGTAPVVLSHIAFGSGQYTATADLTALKAEFKRFESIKGGAIGDNIIHLTIHDYSTDIYTVNEVGVFTDKGTLFGVYSQKTPIIQKASESETMLAIDIALEDINADSITVGDTTFVLNPATTTKQGVIELATEAEAKAGTDTSRAITPKTLDATIEAHDNIVHKSGSETITGAKTFSYGSIILKSNSIDPNTKPSLDKYANYAVYDKDGNWLGVIGAQQNASDNGTSMRFQVIRKINGETKWGASLQCIMTEDGNTYTYAPHPDSSNNTASNKIATVGFVNDPSKSTNIVHRTGDESITGSKTFASTLKFNNTVALCKTNTSDAIRIDGGTDYTNGAFLALHGKDGSATGGFELSANDGTNRSNLVGTPTGTLKWKDKKITLEGDCLPLAGGTLTGTVFTTADGAPVLSAKKGSLNGGRVFLFSPDNDTYSGGVVLRAYSSDNSVYSDFTLKADGTSTWNGKNIVRSINNTTADVNGNVTLNIDMTPYLPRAGGSMTTTKAMTRDVADSFLGLHGGTGENNDGAQLYLCGSNHPTTPSRFQLHARNADTDVILQGGTDGVLEWDGKHVLNNSFLMPTDGGAINLTAGTSSAGGAYFRLYGKDHSSGEGQFVLATTDGESTNALVGKPDGTLTWMGNSLLSSGRNVGDIFYTTRTDTELNGAVECNGGTYNTGDFTGSESIGALLKAKKVPYVSLSEYASLVSANGSCRAFGWDGGNSFRVPTIPAILLTKEQASVVGNGMTLGITNGTSNYGLRAGTGGEWGFGNYAENVYGTSVGTSGATGYTENVSLGITTDPTKSGIVANLDTVQYRAMVQLANEATDEALITATSALQQIANKVDKTSATDRETVVGWGMPDYSAIIKGISFPYTAPTNGEVRFNLDSNTTAYVNGNLVDLGGNDSYNEGPVALRVSKGDVVQLTGSILSQIFIPYKGV